MLDHIGFGVSDLARSKAFYEQALAPLGMRLVMEVTAEQTGGGAHAGFGAAERGSFWIGTGAALRGRLHVAFVAKDRATVDAFYRAAIAAGGKDNGKPGMRPHYHRITTAPSCSIPTATMSRRSVTRRREVISEGDRRNDAVGDRAAGVILPSPLAGECA